MRTYLFWLAIAVCGVAHADDLLDANKLIESKSYSQAVQLLNKLAGAGNADAQFRLGQLYWYGEGVPLDRAGGDALFAQAAAKGSKAAADAMRLTASREQRRADIEYWTTKYDGADLRAGRFACKAPAIPLQSTKNDEIKTVTESVNNWKLCHNGFVDNLADAMPPGKRIPAEIADVMSDQEMEQAKVRLDQVYGRVHEAAKADADRTLARYDSWEKSTKDYVVKENASAEGRRKQVLEQMRNSTMTPGAPNINSPAAQRR
jgi:hypothetical protein